MANATMIKWFELGVSMSSVIKATPYRLLGKHQCLADAFRVLDLNVNQKIGPQELPRRFGLIDSSPMSPYFS